MTAIREETEADRNGIREVNQRAFGRYDEADLVDRLRADGVVIVSLVAVIEGRIAGHILFSELPIETPSAVTPAAALAPMAVLPELQRRGIGSALVRRGLERCREKGRSIAIVVGHPEYYPRFGFSADLARNLRSPFSGPAFMAAELVPGALAGVAGVVRYPAAFRLDPTPQVAP